MPVLCCCCFISPTSGSLAAAGNKGGVTFDAILRSTESADTSDTTYIPQSVEKGIVLGNGETLEFTPENWATSEQEGKLIVSNDNANDAGDPTATPEPIPTETPSQTTEPSETPAPSASPEASAEPTPANAASDEKDEGETTGDEIKKDEEPSKGQFDWSFVYIGIALIVVAGAGVFSTIKINKKKK